MNRVDLLYRAKADAQRQQDRALALSAVSSILRRDALVKGDEDHAGLTLAELDGLACAVGIISDGMWEDGERLADLTAKHLRAGKSAAQRKGGAK